MYAIIRTGGKQFTVKPGDVVQVPKLANDLGSEVEISEVLLVGGDNAIVGSPLVKDAKITAVITKQGKTRKVDVFKKKRRQSYRNWNTHRQEFTEIFVKAISAGGKVAKADGEAKVVDVAQARLDRIENKKAAARARREDKETRSTMKKPAVAKKATAAKKKVAKKAAPKKSGKKVATKKKVAKKTAKKTTKK
ncbi:MAG: 50S ribosomal protein L21 [Bdellovibrionaceae bacterium]|nr:50S ribosomal protein L21 [Pseudobdellovibrionaceae bacterium]